MALTIVLMIILVILLIYILRLGKAIDDLITQVKFLKHRILNLREDFDSEH